MEKSNIAYLNTFIDKHIDYLFITFYKDGLTIADNKEIGGLQLRRLYCDRGEEEHTVINLITNRNIVIKNILFNNASICSEKLRLFLRNRKVNVSFYERGWFPHTTTWHFDPLGFSHNSLLAKSRLDNIAINEEYVEKEIQQFKNKHYILHPSFKIPKPYILFIMQYTNDSTIKYGYPEFENWQKLIDYSSSLRMSVNETFVIKMHPHNINYENLKIALPNNSIAIESPLYNANLMQNARMVIGVNSTMLYEASLLFKKPVLALGNSWFDIHTEVVKKINIGDKINAHTVSEKDFIYRRKMYHMMTRMQIACDSDLVDMIKKHKQASVIKKIKDWMAT